MKKSGSNKNASNFAASSKVSSGQVKTGNGNLLSSIVAATPLWKGAQSSNSVIQTQPQFFSPLHTAMNWQIASKRREVYNWSFISPCKITNYDDMSLLDIEDVYPISSYIMDTPFANIENLHNFQDGYGNVDIPDMMSKRLVNKKANKIKVRGVAEPINVTGNHNCIVIKREDVQCKKCSKKNCVSNTCSSTCKRSKCDLSFNKNYKISKIVANGIKKGDFFLVPFSREVRESVINDSTSARYAGHLAADGWVCHGNNKIGYEVAGVCMNKNEKDDVFPSVKQLFDSYGVDTKIHSQGDQLLVVRTSEKKVVDFSKKLVVGKGSKKKFTSEVMFLDPKLQLDVLGAYIQSDGSYNKINKSVDVTCYSSDLAYQLSIISYRCGILASVNKQPISSSDKTFKTDNKFRYIISISSSECDKIKEYVPGKLKDFLPKKRKQNKRFFWKNYVVSPVTSNVEFDYHGYVYDIRMPKTNTITANGIAIHQCRFFFSSEAKISAAINFTSSFPCNGFKLECRNKKILKYYERQAEKLRLNHWARMISFETHLLGDCFPFTNIKCDKCRNTGITPEGEECNHPDGEIDRLFCLNPDWIEVTSDPLADIPQIQLIPDDDLRMIIQRREPRAIFERLPQMLIDSVANGQPITLSSRCASHIKNNASPYGTYGESLIRCLFPILAYKQKLMTANWIVAERLIIPIRLVQIGETTRPASQDDLSEFANQLAAVANDPNLTIVTHHAVKMDWIGSCYSDDTEILTQDGWKYFYDIAKDEEIVATYSKNTKNLEYQKIIEYFEYDYDSAIFGPMYNFYGRAIDVCVTPNHRMLISRKGETGIIISQDVQLDDKFISTMGWVGSKNTNYEYLNGPLAHLSLDEYLEFLGYFLSEGSLKVQKTHKNNKEKSIVGCAIGQARNSKYYEAMKESAYKVHPTCYEFIDDRTPSGFSILTMNNSKIARHLAETVGSHSGNKSIPKWVKNLPQDKLRILYKAMMDGDGTRRNDKLTQRYKYSTTSQKMANDFAEICLKLGYFTNTSVEKKKCDKHNDMYRIYWSERRVNTQYTLRKENIQRPEYRGKVYCVSVPNGLVITRRNGKITVQGNSGRIHNINQELEYIGKEILDGVMLNQAILNGEMGAASGAAVGVEVMCRRFETWRTTLAEWIENHIFLPIAMMKNFIDEDETKEAGETIYLYPRIKWEDLNLRDRSSFRQSLNQLHDKKLISNQELLKEFDKNWDEQVEQIREEAVVMQGLGGIVGMPQGQGGPGGGGMGGGMDLGNLAIGGGPPMGDIGGGAGGMPSAPGGGMPGAAGGMPGGAPMGDMSGGGADAPMPTASSGLKITKRGKGHKATKEENAPPPMKSLILTGLEKRLLNVLKTISASVPYKLFAQFEVQLPGQPQPFKLDFAYPDIGICCECLHPETLVPTKNGIKLAKDISMGEKLIGCDGTDVEVKNIMTSYYKDKLYTIKAMGIAPFSVTNNHPIYISRPKRIRERRVEPTITRTREYTTFSDNIEKVRADEIKEGDFLLIPKKRGHSEKKIKYLDFRNYKPTKNIPSRIPDFIEIDKDIMWLMGMYAAEGSCGKHVEFSFNIDETDFSNRVQDILFDKFHLFSTEHINIYNHCRRVSCSSIFLSRFMEDNFGKLATNKKMPQWIFNVEDDLKIEFLKAFSDGDGCMRGDKYRLISSSEKMLMDMQALAFSAGFFATICKCRDGGNMQPFTHYLKNGNTITTSHLIHGLWEATLALKKSKKKIYREDENYFYVPVNKITTKDYDGFVYNFTVEGNETTNHKYLIHNIVNGNCDGKVWHEQEGHRERDLARDQKLANVGWRVLRFNEEAIKEHVDEVKTIIYDNIVEAAKEKSNRIKKANGDGQLIKLASPIDQLKDIDPKELKIQELDLPDNLGHLILIGT